MRRGPIYVVLDRCRDCGNPMLPMVIGVAVVSQSVLVFPFPHLPAVKTNV